MDVRTGAILALVAFAGFAAPMFQSVAVAEPTASPAAVGKTTGSLSAVEKANLIAKLKTAKLHDKALRKSLSEGSSAQTACDKKLYDVNVLITKIGNNEDVTLSEVDKALQPPSAAP